MSTENPVCASLRCCGCGTRALPGPRPGAAGKGLVMLLGQGSQIFTSPPLGWQQEPAAGVELRPCLLPPSGEAFSPDPLSRQKSSPSWSLFVSEGGFAGGELWCLGCFCCCGVKAPQAAGAGMLGVSRMWWPGEEELSAGELPARRNSL